ncbi:MAG TPA: GNAT family N-acetyltransferase, partial [Candidatus Eisenbacteria bacterium]|nr:GNAT family N-acetyltransferase [Candidatus Eisenbacteria bacterium]
MHVERTTDRPEDWVAILREDPRATLFLHPRWIEALATAYPRYRPHYLVAHEDGRVMGVLPLMRGTRYVLSEWLSLPFGAHGGPLVRSDSAPRTVAALGEAFRKLVSNPRVYRFEMTIYDPPAEWRAALSPAFGACFHDTDTHVIDLESLDTPFRRSAERSLRAAREAKISVAIESGDAAYDALTRMHEEQVRNWTGIEPYARPVIVSVAASFGADARLYVARRDGQALAACLCLEHEGREIHPWVSGAVPISRDTGAFHLLVDTALRDAAARG